MSSHFKGLSPKFLQVLSLYAFGMALTRHSGQTIISECLGQRLGVKFNTIRQRLREFTYEASAKRGRQRQELVVNAYFKPLLGWVLTKFSSEQCQLGVALDATHLSNRFIVLAVSVVIQGCAIPVAWHIQTATKKVNGARSGNAYSPIFIPPCPLPGKSVF